MSFNSEHESLIDPQLLGYPRLSNASNISTTSSGSRRTPRMATRPESRQQPLNYCVPNTGEAVQNAQNAVSAVTDETVNICGFVFEKKKVIMTLKCLSVPLIIAVIFGITLVPCFFFAKAVIIEDPSTFEEIIDKYQFEVLVTWIILTLFGMVLAWSIYILTKTFFEYREFRQKQRENQKLQDEAHRVNQERRQQSANITIQASSNGLLHNGFVGSA